MRETPLTEWHREHGAKMMEFGGFLMPVEYGGIMDEHRLVRHQVAMFDVSHMAEFVVEGAGAGRFLDYLVTNEPSRLEVGQALYTPMCYPDGGTVDDLLIYRLQEDQFWLVVNAGNYTKDWEWVTEQKARMPDVTVTDISLETALIAVQGPEAVSRLTPLADRDIQAIPYYHAEWGHITGIPALISRTGYTGEDGYEFYLAHDRARELWDALSEAGIPPAGLGARDTLRLEARLPLYEHELSPEISPLEAGLGPFVKLHKEGDFVGRAALSAQKSKGLSRRLVGLELTQGIARAGYPVWATPEGPEVGQVTSGTHAPELKKAIALALVPVDMAKPGTSLWVAVRGRAVPATVVKTPFYKRSVT